MRRAERNAVALVTGAVLALLGGTPPSFAAQPPSAGSPSTQANEIESVTLAHGVPPTSLFGRDLLTPLDPSTTFVNTDVPYAIIRIKGLEPNTTVTLKLTDPTGASYTVQSSIPHKGNPKEFDFAAPLYILGTDLETHTGTWHLQVLINDSAPSDETFQWQPATAADLAKVKDAVNASPLVADLHWRYGAALALLGHPDEAIGELQNAIRLDPNYALFYITLGRIYQRENDTADATQQFQKALNVHGSAYDAVFEHWARADLAKVQGH
jgi:hypothetical protein